MPDNAPNDDEGTPVAVIRTQTISPRDNVRLLLARCPGDRHDVCHGGGSATEPVVLGTRIAHCSCVKFYTLHLGPGAEVTT